MDEQTNQQRTYTAAQGQSNENMWVTVCHLSGILIFFLPPANIVVPLIIWLTHRDQFPFLNEQGREVLNFQISVTIYSIVAGVLILILIGFVLLPLVLLFALVMCIIGAVKASSGFPFRYPLSIRFIN